MEEKKVEEKKTGKVLKGMIVGLIVGGVTVMGIVTVFIIYFFTGGPVQVTKSADEYEDTMRKYTNEVVGKVHTGFFTFPESIPESAFANGSEPTFFFSYKDTWDDPTCEVYLKCSYSEADYTSEIDRLKNSTYELKNGNTETISKLEYDDSERFSFPVYKAIDCDNHSYEYAMDLGNNEIAYIYTSFKRNPSSLKKIPEEYLPNDYEDSLKNNSYSNGGYNVYVVEKTDEFKSLDYGDKYK